MKFIVVNAGLYKELFTSEPMTGEELVQDARDSFPPGILPKIEAWVADPLGSTLLRINDAFLLVRVEGACEEMRKEREEWKAAESLLLKEVLHLRHKLKELG